MKIAVVGDVMVDRYWHIASGYSKVNPESMDGRAYSVQREEWKLGGAANVANLIRGFGDDALLYGAIGDDPPGSILAGMCVEAGIERRLRRSESGTTIKTRVILDRRLMSDRYDFDTLDGRIGPLDDITDADVVVVQDYRKGAICRGLVSAIRKRVADRVPVIVDPGIHITPALYDGATIIKANKAEAVAWSEFSCGKHPPRFVADAMQSTVIVTNDGKPVEIYEPNKSDVIGLPVERVDVVDVCGAGDTIVAALAHRLAHGDDLIFAMMFAIRAAAKQCLRIGCHQVKLEEVMV